MVGVRGLLTALLLVVALTLQVSVLADLAVDGVVPDLVLLVVVAVAFERGPSHAAALGFVAGLMLDLAPPAEHVVGRWALALVVAGYLAGLVRRDARESAVAALVAVAGCSFVASSLFALSGLALSEPGVTVPRVLQVVPVSVGLDVVAAVLVVPLVTALVRRTTPEDVRGVLV